MPNYPAGQAFTLDYFPTSGGSSYDPATAGGAVTTLQIYSNSGRTTLVQTSGPATKIGSGQYRFNVTALSAAVYYLVVTWTASGTGPTVVDSTGLINVVTYAGGVDPTTYEYCSISDLVLGDLQIPSTVDRDTYIRRASRDIDIALGQRYLTPVTGAQTFTTNLLKNVCADLASAYLVLAQAQGHEDNLPNAYGIHLWERAKAALEPYIDGKELPGATLAVTAQTSTAPASITQQDDPQARWRAPNIFIPAGASLLQAYEDFIAVPTPGVYGGGFNYGYEGPQ